MHETTPRPAWSDASPRWPNERHQKNVLWAGDGQLLIVLDGVEYAMHPAEGMRLARMIEGIANG